MLLIRKFSTISRLTLRNNTKIPFNKIINPQNRNYALPSIRPRLKEEHFLLKDKIPKGYQIIYRAPMETYFIVTKNLSTVTALFVAGLAIYEYGNLSKYMNLPLNVHESGLITSSSDLVAFTFAFVCITVVIRIMISRYPLRIYRNHTNYIAIFEGQLPFKYRAVHFKKGEVAEIPKTGVLPWQEARYSLKNRKIFLLENYFKTPAELNGMLIPS